VEEECARELQHLFTISINHLLRGLSGRALKYSLPSAPGRWEEGEVARGLFPSTARPPSCGCNRNGSLMIAARRLKPHERHLIRRARLCLDRGNSSLAFSVREAKEKQLKEQKKAISRIQMLRCKHVGIHLASDARPGFSLLPRRVVVNIRKFPSRETKHYTKIYHGRQNTKASAFHSLLRHTWNQLRLRYPQCNLAGFVGKGEEKE
jgi:hypothetical protein